MHKVGNKMQSRLHILYVTTYKLQNKQNVKCDNFMAVIHTRTRIFFGSLQAKY